MRRRMGEERVNKEVEEEVWRRNGRRRRRRRGKRREAEEENCWIWGRMKNGNGGEESEKEKGDTGGAPCATNISANFRKNSKRI
jgi:hypothetical protein